MKHGKNLLNIIVYTLVIISLLSVSVFSANGAQTSVNLGTAGDFVILTKSGISTTGTTAITGDIGVSPIDSTAITGFGLILDSSTRFATSSLVTGKAYAADYSPPTPSDMTIAVSNMETAYTDAQGRTNPTATELGAGNIGGLTLASGLYKWGTGVTIPTDITLSGGANDIWIFQIAQDLNLGNGVTVILSGGAQAKNIFWQVAGQATLGTTSNMKGIILSKTAIVLNTGAILNGRALAQTAVTLDANAVTAPTGTTPVTTPIPTQNLTSNLSQNLTSNLSQNLTSNLSQNLTSNLSQNLTSNLSQNSTSTSITTSGSGNNDGRYCKIRYSCTEWSSCSAEGRQIRTCIDLNRCRNEDKIENIECTYTAEIQQVTTTQSVPAASQTTDLVSSGQDVKTMFQNNDITAPQDAIERKWYEPSWSIIFLLFLIVVGIVIVEYLIFVK